MNHRLGYGDCEGERLPVSEERQIHRDIAEFVEPKLGRVEVTGDGGGPLKVALAKSDADL